MATAFLASHHKVSGLSVITRSEVLVGAKRATWDSALTLLNQFPNFSVDGATAEFAARLRQKERWKLPDALVAATAILNKAKLVTRNTKDFPQEKYPFVWVPYRLT
jgi:predicted nucleic acid-binding protein